MNVVLWVLQALLAVLFLAAGFMKLTQPKEKFKARMPYVEDFSQQQIRAIGAVELLGALGLVLPWATGIAPILTPRGVGLGVTVIVAAQVHRRRKGLREPGTARAAVIVASAVLTLGGRSSRGRRDEQRRGRTCSR